MLRSRFRFLLLLLFAGSAAALGGCASGTRVATSAQARLEQLSDSINAHPPADSDFLPFEGDEQIVAGRIFGKDVYGAIQPHRDAAAGGLQHGKIIARIKVDHNYRDYKADKWNYWVLADTSAARTGKWVSLWVSDRDMYRVAPLVRTPKPHPHPHPRARWQSHSAATPWTTCSGLECCCDQKNCRS